MIETFRSGFLCLMLASGLITGATGEDLPWIYDDSARPADVVSVESPVVESEVTALKYAADDAPIDWLITFFEQTFQVDDQSYRFRPGFLLFVR